MDNVIWTLGIDAGEKSVGLAAVQYDENGEPQGILAALSHIHDGGKDPDGQSSQSRKATAGVARRTRRLRARRRERLEELAGLLTELGCIVPLQNQPQTYEAWSARARLVREYVEESTEKDQLLGLAIMHMGHFRGWRNPWWNLTKLASLPVPSNNLANMSQAASVKFGVSVDSLRTVGELGALSQISPSVPLRPKVRGAENSSNGTPRSKKDDIAHWVFFEQIRQEDILYELRLICETQQRDGEFFRKVSQVLLKQNKPTVPEELVGHDPFDRSPRALRASLEFQEFRIRDKVANLRVLQLGEKSYLSPELHEEMVQHLLGWRQDPPTWYEVAEHFGIDERALSVEDTGDGSPARAPIDQSSRLIEGSKRLKTVNDWWKEADFLQRSDLVCYLAEPVDVELPASIVDLLGALSDDEFAELEQLKFPSGRSSYGRTSLKIMNEVMKSNSCDLYRARRTAFNVDQYWKPPKASFAQLTGQPAVDRNLAIVRRFLMAAVEKWGAPQKVVIEHVREAFLGTEAIASLKLEQSKRRRENDKIREELRIQGISDPARRDILKRKLLQLQNCQCLYCGETVDWDSVELDHIVARTGGGSNRASNLVAVCRRCNSEKGKRPFGLYANQTQRPGISIEEATKRVKEWQKIGAQLSNAQFGKYQTDVIRRLRRISEDEPLDERSLNSTAYAALEIRERIEQFLEAQAGSDSTDRSLTVQVYNGRATKLARSASGLGNQLQLRGETSKTRLDRRHHAIDALIITSLSPPVARVLVERDDMRDSERIVQGDRPSYKEHFGRAYGDRVIFRRWLEMSARLAGLIAGAVRQDQIPVMNPIRLRPEIGALHKDTVRPLVAKRLGDSFSAAEIRRIVDRKVYEVLQNELDGRGALPQDQSRRTIDEKRNQLGSGDQVKLFPADAAMLPVQEGAVELGSIHHTRVYAWKNPRGKITYGMIRVFGGEFGRIGFRREGVDVLTKELPLWSESWRLAETRVLERILDGTACQIGWLTIGDELDFQSSGNVPGTGDIKRFLAEYPEVRWQIDGFPSPSKLRLRPLYLAAEGLSEENSKVASTIINRPGWWPSIDVACSPESLSVIRRTALGSPRWRSTVLPISWSPHHEANQALR